MTILFVCLGVFVSLENVSLIWRRHLYRWRAANFDLCSALMAIEQWEFFSVPHLLRHGSSPRTRDIHTYCRAFGSGAVTTCCNDLGLSRDNIVMDVVIVLDALNWAELWSVALKFLLHDRKRTYLLKKRCKVSFRYMHISLLLEKKSLIRHCNEYRSITNYSRRPSSLTSVVVLFRGRWYRCSDAGGRP